MGSRASQLRNRQQVQDSSATENANSGLASSDIKALCCDNTNGSNNNIIDISNNNNIDEDVTKIKEAFHAAAAIDNQGDVDTTQQQSNVQQANGNNISTANQQKVSTLQRQASHIQSLAQRIKRSSSVRRFIPSFVSGKRKVSYTKFYESPHLF